MFTGKKNVALWPLTKFQEWAKRLVSGKVAMLPPLKKLANLTQWVNNSRQAEF